jgi:hypothetical protein
VGVEAMFRRSTSKRILPMADRVSDSITIGGRVRRSTIPRLIRAIEEDNGLKDWDGEPIDDNSIVSGELLDVYAFDLPGGIFESVESFCELNKVAFVRSSGSCSGPFGSERVVFDGLDPARHYELNESGEHWCMTCSGRDVGEFGGGWCVVFPDRIAMESTGQAVRRALRGDMSCPID